MRLTGNKFWGSGVACQVQWRDEEGYVGFYVINGAWEGVLHPRCKRVACGRKLSDDLEWRDFKLDWQGMAWPEHHRRFLSRNYNALCEALIEMVEARRRNPIGWYAKALMVRIAKVRHLHLRSPFVIVEPKAAPAPRVRLAPDDDEIPF
jgi:hypothetical protein